MRSEVSHRQHVIADVGPVDAGSNHADGTQIMLDTPLHGAIG